MKQTFKIPVEWAVYSTVEIEAESLEEAIEIFDKIMDYIPLPTEPNYIDGSFQRVNADEPIEQAVEYYSLFQ